MLTFFYYTQYGSNLIHHELSHIFVDHWIWWYIVTWFCCSKCVQHGPCCRLLEASKVHKLPVVKKKNVHKLPFCPMVAPVVHYYTWYYFGHWVLVLVLFVFLYSFLILMYASWQQIYVATFNKLTLSFTDTYVGQDCKNKVHMNF